MLGRRTIFAMLLGLPMALASAPRAPAQTTTEWLELESGPVHPIRVSADGTRLYALNVPDARLAIYSLADPDRPILLREVAVGLEPVSVTERQGNEVWVAELLSDTVSIVDVEAGEVVAVLQTGDEPSDVAFAGGKAFVTCASEDAVRIYDAASRAPLGTVAIFSKHPRALAVSPDGDRVWVLAQRSGNGTTILPKELAPPPPAPTNPALPPAPATSLIVHADDPQWSSLLPISVPDLDLFAIDVATQQIVRAIPGVGTTCFDLIVDPMTEAVLVANTEARNHVRFEPVLRGHVIDSRITHVAIGAQPPVATAVDLNPTLAYASLPDPASIAVALAEPTALALDPAARRLWVAAQGTDRLAVLDADQGTILARLDVGASGAGKRGPRGLALHPFLPRLYVHNRIANSLTVVDTDAVEKLTEHPIGTFDPTPAEVKAGRAFLYDARLSGNGSASCAACHVDGDTDGLAWDLGDPGGVMQQPSPQTQPSSFDALLGPTHPMKGPMLTQTLRGLSGTGPLHWRGDRADLTAFNPAFDALLGGSEISAAEMELFDAWLGSVVHPPNPKRALNDVERPGAEADGLAAFVAPVSSAAFGPVSCMSCHASTAGTNGTVVPLQAVGAGTQQIKVAQLRGLWRREGMAESGPSKTGFGFLHDGSAPTLASILDLPIFASWSEAQREDMVPFLEAFRGDLAPIAGRRLVVEAPSLAAPEVVAALGLLEAGAIAGAVEAVLRGRIDGRARGFWRDPALGLWRTDRAAEAPRTLVGILVELAQKGGRLVAIAAPPGRGRALGIDRDLDGTTDGDEAAVPYGHATSACGDFATLELGSSARLGSEEFALVTRGAPPGASVTLAVTLEPAAASLGALAVWVDVGTIVGAATTTADARGVAAVRLPLPDVPELAGVDLHAQAVWLDACAVAPAGTHGLAFTLAP